MIFYSFALTMAMLLGAPYWLFCMVRSGKYREGFRERFGIVPRRIKREHGRPVIWVHAVSVGELLAASHLLTELQKRLPDWRLVVSTTTGTGQRLARERFGQESVCYFPLDFAFAVRSYLRALRPALLVLVETEFWPRMLVECRKAQVPVAVVNARISDRSWPRYRRLRFLWKRLLRGLALALTQSEQDMERLRALGVTHVRLGGNLKFDVRASALAPLTQCVKEHLAPQTRVLICGSTLDGEEKVLIENAPEDCLLVLAPRHPERFDAVAHLLRQQERRWVRRSEWAKQPQMLGNGQIFLLDSIGELASLYSLAKAAFIGGSLVPSGGHNPLEAAQFAVPVVIGPHYENFRAIVEKLRAADAIRIATQNEIGAVLRALLQDDATARGIGERGQAVFMAESGATARAVEALVKLVEERR